MRTWSEASEASRNAAGTARGTRLATSPGQFSIISGLGCGGAGWALAPPMGRPANTAIAAASIRRRTIRSLPVPARQHESGMEFGQEPLHSDHEKAKGGLAAPPCPEAFGRIGSVAIGDRRRRAPRLGRSDDQ